MTRGANSYDVVKETKKKSNKHLYLLFHSVNFVFYHNFCSTISWIISINWVGWSCNEIL